MKVLFVEPNEITLNCFRRELLDHLLKNNISVTLCIKATKRIYGDYQNKVDEIINLDCDLKNTNPFLNLSIKRKYKAAIKKAKPDIILSYTIKPNIFCASYSKKIPIITNITGLGTAFNKKNFLNKIVTSMYRKAFRNVDCIMFQNRQIYNTFLNNRIPINEYRIIPGSGVNISKFAYRPLERKDSCHFLYCSRMIKEKGFNLLLKCIPTVIRKNPNAVFTLLGKLESDSDKTELQTLLNCYPSNVFYFERTNDTIKFYHDCDFLVSPSYYNEGISNVLLESLSCGRPIITTNDNHGCLELLDSGKNGIGITSNSDKSLEKGLLDAISMSFEQKRIMGSNGRQFVERHYNRDYVIDIYKKAIEDICTHSKKRG